MFLVSQMVVMDIIGRKFMLTWLCTSHSTAVDEGAMIQPYSSREHVVVNLVH